MIGVFTTDIGALSTYTSLWGYESFADVSLVAKMADSPDAVQAFLLDLAERLGWPVADLNEAERREALPSGTRILYRATPGA